LIVISIQALAPAVEVQVNGRTTGDQKNVAVATGVGGSVIVWADYYSTAGRSYDILARRLDVMGKFLGNEFLVNTTTPGNQNEPAVARDNQGRFAVVWQGPGPDQEDIFLRLFDPNGNARTPELAVNLVTAGRQLYPSVAVSGAGTLVVAWESRETAQTVVRVQLFDPNGSRLGDEVVVDTDIYDCRYPQVAMASAGRFAVTWMQDRSVHPIVVRLFDPCGVPLTLPQQVNTANISFVPQPTVAMNSRGYFLVAWDGHPKAASQADIYARCYEPTGVARGQPFLVNTRRAGARQPQAAIDDANEFIVVWQHDTGDPNLATDIAARCFDAKGVPLGDQFQVNTYALDEQRYPAVTMANDGSYLAAWESQGQDGSGYGIFAVLEPSLRPADPNQKD
jgi:hypothetical protein